MPPVTCGVGHPTTYKCDITLIDNLQERHCRPAIAGLGASAGLAPAIEHYADCRVVPGDLAAVVVGLDRAADALAGRVSPGPGTKIHIDPRR
jgi:hypothetical protein